MSLQKKCYISQKQQPRLEGGFFGKVAIWYLGVTIECVAYSIEYLTYEIDYLKYKTTYFKQVLNKPFITVYYIEFPIRVACWLLPMATLSPNAWSPNGYANNVNTVESW